MTDTLWFRAPVTSEVIVECWSDAPMTLEAVEGLEKYLNVMKRAFNPIENPASASGLGSGGGEDYSLSPSSEEHAPDERDSSDDGDTHCQYIRAHPRAGE